MFMYILQSRPPTTYIRQRILSAYGYRGSRLATELYFLFATLITLATPHGLFPGGSRTHRERGDRRENQGTIGTCGDYCL